MVGKKRKRRSCYVCDKCSSHHFDRQNMFCRNCGHNKYRINLNNRKNPNLMDLGRAMRQEYKDKRDTLEYREQLTKIQEKFQGLESLYEHSERFKKLVNDWRTHLSISKTKKSQHHTIPTLRTAEFNHPQESKREAVIKYAEGMLEKRSDIEEWLDTRF
jgi:ribosomal protein L37E/ribosomal protein L32E